MNNLWYLFGGQGPRSWPLPDPPAQGPAPGGQDHPLDDQGGQGPAAGAQGLPEQQVDLNQMEPEHPEERLVIYGPAPAPPPGPPPIPGPPAGPPIHQRPATWLGPHPPPAPGGPDVTVHFAHTAWMFPQSPAAPAEPEEPDPQHYVPPTEVLTTLGWMKHLEVPYFEYFEWKHLKVVNWFLTDKWPLLQAGIDEEATDLWIKATRVLELDNKARRDLFLLAQSGYVGRTLANKVLFESLNVQAADRQYRDLSNLVSHEVYKHRKVFDRPPRKHGDLACWTWESYISPPAHLRKWAPDQVPRVPEILTGPGGKPLPPPTCWGPCSRW